MDSKPRGFSTSTMKSEPGRSAVSTSTPPVAETGPVSSASARADGTVTARRFAGSCATAGVVPAASAAAPTAAPFRKPRRFGMTSISLLSEGQLSLTLFLFFNPGSEQHLEKPFAHQALHRTVID